jgi:hypothetical protein
MYVRMYIYIRIYIHMYNHTYIYRRAASSRRKGKGPRGSRLPYYFGVSGRNSEKSASSLILHID